MQEKATPARELFDIYARLNDEAMRRDLTDEERATLGGLFAEHVVGSSPQGVVSAEAARLPDILKDSQANYRRVGGKRFKIASVEISGIDDIHLACTVAWVFDYVNAAGSSGSVRFSNIYYLTFAGGSPKIFAFITPDEGKAMREHGLV